MKAALILMSILSWSLLLMEKSDTQSITSPFVYFCKRNCGNMGWFRRFCCMIDEVCCTKPNDCPKDPTANVLIKLCQRCTNDVDCMFSAKCCESEGRKCCTSVRTPSFGTRESQRATVKVGSSTNNTGYSKAKNLTEIKDEKAHLFINE